MLSPDQRREFKRSGFLVLPGALDTETISAARESVWSGIPEDRDDRSTWEPGAYRNAREEVADADALRAVDEAVHPYIEDLLADVELPAPGRLMQVQLRFPSGNELTDPTAAQPTDRTGHVDGFGQYSRTGTVGYTTTAGVVYLDEVPPRGGGFTVWPGSHRVLSDFFDEYPPEALGELGSRPPAITPDGWNLGRRLQDQLDPFEITGPAGTLVLWHGKLLHTAGVHHGPNVRMAAIPRYRPPDPDAVKRPVAAEIWRLWDGFDELSLPRVSPAD